MQPFSMSRSGTAFFNLAGVLIRRGIPILFYTSWTDTSLIPVELRTMPFLEKPVHLVLVAKLLARMIADGQVLEIQAEKDFDPNSVSDHLWRGAPAHLRRRPHESSANDPEDLSDVLETVAGESR